MEAGAAGRRGWGRPSRRGDEPGHWRAWKEEDEIEARRSDKGNEPWAIKRGRGRRQESGQDKKTYVARGEAKAEEHSREVAVGDESRIGGSQLTAIGNLLSGPGGLLAPFARGVAGRTVR